NTPSEATSSNGYTWYENGTNNAKWLDGFARTMRDDAGLSPEHTYVAGYSGGAEHITYDVLTEKRDDWLDGGAIMIAGGGTELDNGTHVTPHNANNELSMTWYAGENDTAGETNPPEWSAHSASSEGYNTYRNAGYTNTTWEELPNVGHHDYNISSLVNTSTTAVPEPEPEPTDKPSEEPTESPEPEPTDNESEEPTEEPTDDSSDDPE